MFINIVITNPLIMRRDNQEGRRVIIIIIKDIAQNTLLANLTHG